MLQDSLDMKVVTGAEVNVIPAHIWRKLKRKPTLQKTKTILKTTDDTEISKDGIATILDTAGDVTITYKVYVTKSGPSAILGLHASMALNLVTPRDNGDCLHSLTAKKLVDNNPDDFSCLGLYPDEYHLKETTPNR